MSVVTRNMQPFMLCEIPAISLCINAIIILDEMVLFDMTPDPKQGVPKDPSMSVPMDLAGIFGSTGR